VSSGFGSVHTHVPVGYEYISLAKNWLCPVSPEIYPEERSADIFLVNQLVDDRLSFFSFNFLHTLGRYRIQL
jgi:hypothetical protein